jgi:hypothetical protein
LSLSEEKSSSLTPEIFSKLDIFKNLDKKTGVFINGINSEDLCFLLRIKTEPNLYRLFIAEYKTHMYNLEGFQNMNVVIYELSNFNSSTSSRSSKISQILVKEAIPKPKDYTYLEGMMTRFSGLIDGIFGSIMKLFTGKNKVAISSDIIPMIKEAGIVLGKVEASEEIASKISEAQGGSNVNHDKLALEIKAFYEEMKKQLSTEEGKEQANKRREEYSKTQYFEHIVEITPVLNDDTTVASLFE